MNGSELLLPFVIADQRRRADQAVLVRLAHDARNSNGGNGIALTGIAGRLRNRFTALVDRGQLGPVAHSAPVC